MLQILGLLAIVLAAVLAVWTAVWAIRDRPVVLRQLLAGAVVEAVLLIQLVAALVVDDAERSPGTGTYWLYVGFVLLLLPVAALWALAERTRWSSIVLLVACVAVAAMQWRVLTIWTGQ